jgi:opacity protein-like surface antigen
MKNSTKKITSLIALAVASSISLSANAADTNWYVGISANQADLDSVNTISTSQVGGASRRLNLDSDDELGFGIQLGRNVFTQANGNIVSIELAYSNSDHDIENIQFMNNNFSTAAGTAEGSLDIETILARAVYKFDLGNFKPYLGLGIGETDLEVEARYGGSVGQGREARPPFASGSDSATAIELRAGVEYSVSDQFGIFLEYTTTDVDDVQFSRLGGGPGGLATTTQEGDFDFDSINLGVSFHF